MELNFNVKCLDKNAERTINKSHHFILRRSCRAESEPVQEATRELLPHLYPVKFFKTDLNAVVVTDV